MQDQHFLMHWVSLITSCVHVNIVQQGLTLPECMTLTEIFPKTIFFRKTHHDCKLNNWTLKLKHKYVSKLKEGTRGFGSYVLDFNKPHLFHIQNQKGNQGTLIVTGRNRQVSRNQTAILAGLLKSIMSSSFFQSDVKNNAWYKLDKRPTGQLR